MILIIVIFLSVLFWKKIFAHQIGAINGSNKLGKKSKLVKIGKRYKGG